MKLITSLTLSCCLSALVFSGCGLSDNDDSEAKGLPPSDLDFAKLIPKTISRSSVFKLDDFMVWGADMVRTEDGVCHLVFSHWPKSLGHEAWVTHSMIGHATADKPEGPYTYQGPILPPRGKGYWDGFMTHNPTIVKHNDKYYLYYGGTSSEAEWSPDTRILGEERWKIRLNQRVGVAVADHPAGPWKRFDKPLLETGEFGAGVVATPCAEVTPENKVHLYYKTQAPGEDQLIGQFGGGVFHYCAVSENPLGPFKKYDKPIIDKSEVYPDIEFRFHIDDHEEWFQDDRYYAIVKDHDPPFLTYYGDSLYLIESPDGLNWKLSNHLMVKDRLIKWDSGKQFKYRRLEMPKVYREKGVPKVLFLAALEDNDMSQHSYNIAIPLGMQD